MATKLDVTQLEDHAFLTGVRRNGVINGGMMVSQENGANAVALTNNSPKYFCDIFSVLASGTALSAGTVGQINNSSAGVTGYSAKVAGITLTGSGTISWKHRIESMNAVQFKNNPGSMSVVVLHDVGSNINYTLTAKVAYTGTADNFSSRLTIKSTTISVPSGVPTLLTLENCAMGTYAKDGIELEVSCACGAVTAKNFEITEWQFNFGESVLPFCCRTMMEELANVQRYYEIGETTFSCQITTGQNYFVQIPFHVTKRVTPVISQVNLVAVGFTATPNNNRVTSEGYRAYHVSNSTSAQGEYIDSWKADARLGAA